MSRPQPKKNPAGITLEIRFIDVGSENNCRIFRFFDFSSIFSYFTRFQRLSFDFLSNPGLWLVGCIAFFGGFGRNGGFGAKIKVSLHI